MSEQPLRVAGVDVGSSAIKVVVLEDFESREPNVLVMRRERVRRRDPADARTVDLRFHGPAQSLHGHRVGRAHHLAPAAPRLERVSVS